jgi:hypothetical protein
VTILPRTLGEIRVASMTWRHWQASVIDRAHSGPGRDRPDFGRENYAQVNAHPTMSRESNDGKPKKDVIPNRID